MLITQVYSTVQLSCPSQQFSAWRQITQFRYNILQSRGSSCGNLRTVTGALRENGWRHVPMESYLTSYFRTCSECQQVKWNWKTIMSDTDRQGYAWPAGSGSVWRCMRLKVLGLKITLNLLFYSWQFLNFLHFSFEEILKYFFFHIGLANCLLKEISHDIMKNCCAA